MKPVHDASRPTLKASRAGAKALRAIRKRRLRKTMKRSDVARINIDFSTIDQLISDALLQSIKSTLKWYASNRTILTQGKAFNDLRQFLKHAYKQRGKKVRAVLLSDVQSYILSVPKKRLEGRIGSLRSFLGVWNTLQIPGLQRGLNTYLQSIRLPSRARGEHVTTDDPNYGPFTDLDFDLILSAIGQMESESTEQRWARLALLLEVTFGLRPVQCALLKVGDVSYAETAGARRCYLTIPRVKQAHQAPRTEFRTRIVPLGLDRELEEYVRLLKERFRGRQIDESQLPLFPARDEFLIDGSGEVFPSIAPDFSQATLRGLRKMRLRSVVSGKPIKITMYRFRRTFATRAHAEGWPASAIAEALDHMNLTTVLEYVAKAADLSVRLDKHLANKLAPIAHCFAGRIINDESEATRSGNRAARVTTVIEGGLRSAGSCAQDGSCSLRVPIACYRCPRFEPWLDGPHEAVLEQLWAERELLGQASSERIAQITDLDILAVEEVVQLCRKVKAMRES